MYIINKKKSVLSVYRTPFNTVFRLWSVSYLVLGVWGGRMKTLHFKRLPRGCNTFWTLWCKWLITSNVLYIGGVGVEGNKRQFLSGCNSQPVGAPRFLLSCLPPPPHFAAARKSLVFVCRTWTYYQSFHLTYKLCTCFVSDAHTDTSNTSTGRTKFASCRSLGSAAGKVSGYGSVWDQLSVNFHVRLRVKFHIPFPIHDLIFVLNVCYRVL
jgi:hypothetical protein